MTLFEQATGALAEIRPELRTLLIEQANQWLYGRSHGNLDYAESIRILDKSGKESDEKRAQMRRAFLTSLLSSANHALGRIPARPEPRYPKPGDGFLTLAAWKAHLKELDDDRAKANQAGPKPRNRPAHRPAR